MKNVKRPCQISNEVNKLMRIICILSDENQIYCFCFCFHLDFLLSY